MMFAPPRPFFGHRPIKALIRSRFGQRMVKANGKMAVSVFDMKSTSYKKAVKVVKAVKVTLDPLRMRAHVFFFLFLYLVFIKKNIDHVDQANNTNGFRLDRTL
ncbi:hypothetical protein [Desulfobacula phenolica]|uniref:Uncharacterized protein n=1 Tax=Desulfobacula phenolica TaxID=90732 RepID=A0A1H2I480_9BACT|nr:hypothetical protein [Desulfobacula phenolica]SDU38716.1 hypothetical protein SAMN04487931_107216 [Desulfobacula phenolica]